jgi:hypothetical protein
MSTTREEYLKRAEECERLAAQCRSESNREIFLEAAAKWWSMAPHASAGTVPEHRRRPCRTSDRMPNERRARGSRRASNASACRLTASHRNYLLDGTLRAHASTHGVEQRK